jgi:putative transposase
MTAASQPYPSDLSDQEGAFLAPLLPPAKPGGRPRSVDLRQIGVRSAPASFPCCAVAASGCHWRLTPREYGPWSTLYAYCAYWRRWRRDGRWEQIHRTIYEQVRRRLGRQPTPSPPPAPRSLTVNRSRPPSAVARTARMGPRSSPGANAICSWIPSGWS